MKLLIDQTLVNVGLATSTGNFDVNNHVNHSAGAISSFFNVGTLQKTAGNNASNLQMNLFYHGIVNVFTGTLGFGRTGIHGQSDGLFTMAPGATLDLHGSHDLEPTSVISGAGSVDFSSAGTTVISVTYSVSGGTSASGNTVNFEILPDHVGPLSASIGSLNFNTGQGLTTPEVTLSGSGQLYLTGGLLVSDGYTQSGSNSLLSGDGTMTVTGALTWSGGITPTLAFNQFNITQQAIISGTLDISLTGGYEPTIGDTFVIMTFPSRSGEFDTVNGLIIGAGKRFDVLYNPNDVTLKVVTDP